MISKDDRNQALTNEIVNVASTSSARMATLCSAERGIRKWPVPLVTFNQE
jgi:hypothetical protein